MTWDTHVAEVRPINLEQIEEKPEVNKIAIEGLRENHPKIFEEGIEYGMNQYLWKTKVCYKGIN